MGAASVEPYVLGLDLDGVVADFYARIRQLAAEWRGVSVTMLNENVTFGLGEWGFAVDEYRQFHRFAVEERSLFLDMPVISGAPQAIRRLAREGIHIRLLTHRFFVDHLHQMTADQTVRWLDTHAIPYHELCFVQDKAAVSAHLYVEDSPSNITNLQERGRKVVTFTNSTNAELPDVQLRADCWRTLEHLVLADFHSWRKLQTSAVKGRAGTCIGA